MARAERVDTRRSQRELRNPTFCDQSTNCLPEFGERELVQRRLAEESRSQNKNSERISQGDKKLDYKDNLLVFKTEYHQLRKNLELESKTDTKLKDELRLLDESWSALGKVDKDSKLSAANKSKKSEEHINAILKIATESDMRRMKSLPKLDSALDIRQKSDGVFELEVPQGSSIGFRWDYYNNKSKKFDGGVQKSYGYYQMGKDSISANNDNFRVDKKVDSKTGNTIYRFTGHPSFSGRVQLEVNGVAQNVDMNFKSLPNDHINSQGKIEPSIKISSEGLKDSLMQYWKKKEQLKPNNVVSDTPANEIKLKGIPASIKEGESFNLDIPANNKFAVKHPDGRVFLEVKPESKTGFYGKDGLQIERKGDQVRISAPKGSLPWLKSSEKYQIEVSDEKGVKQNASFEVELKDEITKLPQSGSKLMPGSTIEFKVNPNEEISIRRADNEPYTPLALTARSETNQGIIVERNGENAKLTIPQSFNKFGALEIRVRDKVSKIDLVAGEDAPKIDPSKVDQEKGRVKKQSDLATALPNSKRSTIKRGDEPLGIILPDEFADTRVVIAKNRTIQNVEPQMTSDSDGFPRIIRSGASIAVDPKPDAPIGEYFIYVEGEEPLGSFRIQ